MLLKVFSHATGASRSFRKVKMEMRRITILILVVAMLFSIAIPVSAANPGDFTDIPDNWSKTAVIAAISNGLLTGSGNRIMPDADLKRCEMAAIINRAFGAVQKGDISRFTDIPAGKWYADDMAKAVKMGTFNGDGSKIRPEDPINRQEAFAVLARAFKLSTNDYTSLDKFSDKAKISNWAKPELAALAASGYVNGSKGMLNPLSNISRAEFAQVMYNVLKMYIKAAGTYTNVADGNVMINVPDVTLKGVTVKGDLIIGDGVGTGNVTLDAVKVEGRTVVRGGGKNSIHVINGSTINGRVIIDNVNNEVRIVTDQGTTIEKIEADSQVLLEGNFGEVTVIGSTSDSTSGIANVEIKGNVETLNIESDAEVTLTSGTISNVTIAKESTGSKVNIEGATITQLNVLATAEVAVNAGTVDTVNVGQTAQNTIIAVAEGAVVSTVTADTATTITGSGTVTNVQANANDITVDTAGTVVTVSEGVTGVTAGGGEVSGGSSTTTAPADSTTPPAGGSTGGGSSGGGSTGGDTGSGAPTEAELANQAIATAKGLIPSTFTAVEGIDTNLVTALNNINGISATGVTLSVSSSGNSQVATDGVITYGNSQVIGNVTISIAKTNGTTNTKTVSVVIPVHVVTEAELANQAIATAKGLIPSTFTAVEGIDTNLVTSLNNINGISATGVTLSVSSSENSQVTTDGVITYGGSENTGDVTISIAKANGTTDTKTVSVIVPAHAPATTSGSLYLFTPRGRSGSTGNITLYYSPDPSLLTSNSTIVFNIPSEFAADTDDEVFVSSGPAARLDSSQISNSGQTITLSNIDWVNYEGNTARAIELSLKGKTIPEIGTYNFSATGDADGIGSSYSPSAGIGSEMSTFTSIDPSTLASETNLSVTITQTAGQYPGTVKLTFDSLSTGHKYYYQIWSTSLRDELAIRGESWTEYSRFRGYSELASGSELQWLNDQYISIFEVDGTGGIVAFKSILVTGSKDSIIDYTKSLVEIDRPLTQGSTSTVTVTLRDSNGNLITDIPESLIIEAEANGNDTYVINNSNVQNYMDQFVIINTNANKQYTFDVTVPYNVVSGDGITIWIKDIYGYNITGSPIIFTSDGPVADTIAPEFASGYPVQSNVAANNFEINFKLNETSTMYYVMYKHDVSRLDPTVEQIRLGTDGNGSNSDVWRGSLGPVSGGEEASIKFIGLDGSTTYDVFMVACDESNNCQTIVEKLTVTTSVDTMPPEFVTGFPQPLGITGYGFDIVYKLNETSTMYYVMYKHDVSRLDPTVEQIKLGTDGNGSNSDVWGGSFGPVPGGVPAGLEFTGLEDGTVYDVFMVAVDILGNCQTTVTKLNVTTVTIGTDTTAPEFEEGYPILSNVTANSFKINFKLNEIATMYFVMFRQDQNRPEPNVDQVIAGTDGNGDYSIFGGKFPTARSGVELYISISGLESGTTYDVFLVLIDISGNKQAEVTKLSVTTN